MTILTKNIIIFTVADTWMTPQEQYGDVMLFFCRSFDVGELGHKRCHLSKSHSLCENPEWLCGLERITSIDK